MNLFMSVWDEVKENIRGKSRYSNFSDSRFLYTLANVNVGKVHLMFVELFKRPE